MQRNIYLMINSSHLTPKSPMGTAFISEKFSHNLTQPFMFNPKRKRNQNLIQAASKSTRNYQQTEINMCVFLYPFLMVILRVWKAKKINARLIFSRMKRSWLDFLPLYILKNHGIWRWFTTKRILHQLKVQENTGEYINTHARSASTKTPRGRCRRTHSWAKSDHSSSHHSYANDNLFVLLNKICGLKYASWNLLHIEHYRNHSSWSNCRGAWAKRHQFRTTNNILELAKDYE